MEILVCLAILVVLSGPVAAIMALILFNKLGSIDQKLRDLESKGNPSPVQPQTTNESVPLPPTALSEHQSRQPSIPPVSPPSELKPEKPIKTVPEIPMMSSNTIIDFQKPAVVDTQPEQPVKTPDIQCPKPAMKAGLEQKIGTTVALIAGVITVIVGVGFFLKYVYDNKLFSDVARVCIVAGGGLVSLVIGEIIRRRDYGIVAKGLAALGFSLLYASIFSASQVYHLIEPSTALVLALCVSAVAMAYAVSLNELLIAFLSLLGGYLSPVIIMYHQDMPMPIFTYVLALGIGAMGCAMFRRWRAVNWIAMTGTYLLYTVWFEQFYAPSLMATSLVWVSIFGLVYLLQPIVHSLLRKVNSRAEDVSLIVINSVAVFYYLCRILYANYQKEMALAIAGFGVAHLLLMGFVMFRCPDDKKLPAVLRVLGISLVTTAIGLYFANMHPKILGWALEATVLTYIGIRYKDMLTKAMSFIVAGVGVLGLFFLLPMHGDEKFRLIFNGSYGAWLFVAAACVVCHCMWRWMSEAQGKERLFGTQAFYVVAALLVAISSSLEWHAYCHAYYEYAPRIQSLFEIGLILIATVLLAVLVTRPLCPRGRFSQITAAVVALSGAIFTIISTTGIYYEPFKLFFNVPFLCSSLFVGALFWAGYQFHRLPDKSNLQKQLSDSMLLTALSLVGILICEQVYMYWYCRNEYAQPVANWQSLAGQYMAICCAVYGLAMLFVGIRFRKSFIKALGILGSILSVIALYNTLPPHDSGDFRLLMNLSFMTWICVAIGFIVGHGLWRFMPQLEKRERVLPMQLYYIAGIVLMGIGCGLEWFAHCQKHILPAAISNSHFMQGCIVLCAVALLLLFVRSLAPQGVIVRNVGLAIGFAGTLYTAFAMNEVYCNAFTVFANVPFVIALLFVASLLAVAAFVKKHMAGRWKLSPLIVLVSLLLVWVLLSEQIYQYFYCRNQYAESIENWQFSAQMYISVTWAIYAAVLLLIGFFRHAAGVRYLSLAIFTVLLGKINWDIQELPTEYRIATFVTTGLILVGVSFLYQFLKNKGFFEAVQGKKPDQIEKNPVNPVNPV